MGAALLYLDMCNMYLVLVGSKGRYLSMRRLIGVNFKSYSICLKWGITSSAFWYSSTFALSNIKQLQLKRLKLIITI